MAESENCWRCGAELEWRHATWQCSTCRFKLGCCEGEPQTSRDGRHDRVEPGYATEVDAASLVP